MTSLPAGDAIEGCFAPGVVAVVTHRHQVVGPPRVIVADLAAALDDGEAKHVAGGQGRGRWRIRNRVLVLSGTRHMAWNGASPLDSPVLMWQRRVRRRHAMCFWMGPLSDA
jgi:hypothetical protein